MVIITGHSQKLDGICFIVNTNSYAEAEQALCDKWNAENTDQMKLLRRGDNTYFVWTDVPDDAELGDDFGEFPRREGFLLEYRQYDTAKIGEIYTSPILESMPW